MNELTRALENAIEESISRYFDDHYFDNNSLDKQIEEEITSQLEEVKLELESSLRDMVVQEESIEEEITSQVENLKLELESSLRDMVAQIVKDTLAQMFSEASLRIKPSDDPMGCPTASAEQKIADAKPVPSDGML